MLLVKDSQLVRSFSSFKEISTLFTNIEYTIYIILSFNNIYKLVNIKSLNAFLGK